MIEHTETAERPARASTALSAADRRRRTQAVAGAGAGVLVVLALIALLIGVRLSGGDTPTAPAAAPAPSAAPTTPPAEQPSTPASVRTPAALSKEPVVKGGTGTLSALKVSYLVKGKGPKVRAGQTVTANYVLVNYKTGKVLDSSWQRGQPFSYQAGAGNVIQGWDKGLIGVPVGSRVRLDVPAALAYGPQQGDLRFVVDVLAAA
jgi:peptidylprolyl isomerase